MIVRSLLSLLRGKRPAVAYGPQVLVTMERPWEHGRVRRFGPLDQVLGDLALRDLVQSLAEAAGPEEGDGGAGGDVLPARFDIQVMALGESDFRTVSGDCAAASLLAEALAAPDRPHVHQLRIRIMPLPLDGEQERTADVRHSDEPVQDTLAPALEDEGLADQMEAPARPVVDDEVAEKSETPAAPTKRSIRGYMRKTDVLRAELLPKIQALDFSGLFVGNFGIQSRTLDQAHRVSLLDSETANKYLMMANEHRRDGQFDKAIHYYKTLVTHDPDNEDLWFLLGKTAADLGRVRQAAQAFSTAKRLGHGRAKEELAILRAQHPEIADKAGDLVNLWRQSYG